MNKNEMDRTIHLHEFEHNWSSKQDAWSIERARSILKIYISYILLIDI